MPEPTAEQVESVGNLFRAIMNDDNDRAFWRDRVIELHSEPDDED